MKNSTELLEQLEKAIGLAKQVTMVEGDERKAHIDKILKLYNEFHKIVFGITDEVGIIMANYEWALVKYRDKKKNSINKVWKNAAKNFALANGFSIPVVEKLYSLKNSTTAYRENVYSPYTNSCVTVAWQYHYFVLLKKDN